MAHLKGCSANGRPTMLSTRLPVSLALAASSAAAPDPVPPPSAVRKTTSSDLSRRGEMFPKPSMSLCAAKFGSAAVPLASPVASRWRQWASWEDEKEDSSASMRSRSANSEHLAWARSDHPHPIPPTPTMRIVPCSMAIGW